MYATLKKSNISRLKPLRLAKNLCLILNCRQISEAELAQAVDLPLMTIRRLVSGETCDPRISTLKLISNYLNVSLDALLEGVDEHDTAYSQANRPQFVPILDWKTASEVNSINELDLSTWGNWQPITLKGQHVCSKTAFVLESRTSMSPRYPRGTVFVIDPEIEAQDGDIVLFKTKKNRELSLRELVIDPPEWKLLPIIPDSHPIVFSVKEYKIIGIVLLTVLQTRKN